MSLNELNEEQKQAVTHSIGSPMCTLAGAGSGKTRVLQHRVEWLINNGVPPRKILVVTFTNKASAEISKRIMSNSPGLTIQKCPRVCTIHALALAAIRRNPKGFGLKDHLSLLDDYDQGILMRKVIEREIKESEREDYNPWNILKKIAFHRARGLGFSREYTPDIHQQAIHMHKGFHALDSDVVRLWETFEREKSSNSVVDFDDLLCLVNRRVREDSTWAEKWSRMFDHVLLDEGQDTNPVQWELVNSLLAADNLNLCVVGDVSQCQPAGTKVRIVETPPRGSRPAKTVEKDIEAIVDGELVTIWSKHDQLTYNGGRVVKTAKRWYSGDMLTVVTDGKSTRMTPNHWLWVRFNKACEEKYALYLMYREDLGFRIGLTKIKKGANCYGYGLTYRMAQEKADKAWILRVCDHRSEVECLEEIFSLKYSIPECVFEPTAGVINRTVEQIRFVFSSVSREGGRRCLADNNLLEDQPIAYRRGEIMKGRRVYNQSWRGYFKTAAANLIPEIMEIPKIRANASAPITSITRNPFDGWVYSLDVEKDHTYIADGVIVGNSIFGFNGAAPEILKAYSEGWRGVVPKLYRLAQNYRSVPEIVGLANAVQQKMVLTIPLKMLSARGDIGHTGTTSLMKGGEDDGTPREIAHRIASQIYRDRQTTPYKENAILVRSGKSQVRDLEAELVKLRIPYVVRGGQGLLQTEEARDVLAYLRLAVNPKDFMALNRAIAAPKRGLGTVALEKIRDVANKQFAGDLLSGCWAVNKDKAGAFVNTIREIQKKHDDPVNAFDFAIKLSGYSSYLRDKYRKDVEKLTIKLDNLERLALLVVGLLETNIMNLADVVFQLSMDEQAKDEDKDGRVVISTIHKAKGLEYSRVFVTNCYEGSLPHMYSRGNDTEIEEEMRLFYVAITRAKDRLIICVPTFLLKKTSTGWSKTRVEPSRFLTMVGID